MAMMPRPAMRLRASQAKAQKTDMAANSSRPAMNIFLWPKMSPARPETGMKAACMIM